MNVEEDKFVEKFYAIYHHLVCLSKNHQNIMPEMILSQALVIYQFSLLIKYISITLFEIF